MKLRDEVLYHNEDGLLSPCAGQLSLQSQVAYKGSLGHFDDIIGQYWTIVSVKDDPRSILRKEQIELLEHIDVEIVHVTSDHSLSLTAVIDVEGKYEKYFQENELEAVIVRPDYYVFGGAPSLTHLPVLVEDLCSQILSSKSAAI
jgi:hypothetical protein